MESEKSVPPLTIRLFGEMQVLVHGQPLSGLRSRKESQLLALLVLAPDHIRKRNALAQTLWPHRTNRDPALPGNYLRRSLGELRRALGFSRLPNLSDQTVSLDLEGVEADVIAFNQALEEGTPEGLERAIALHHKPLLLEYEEEWVKKEREKYRQRYRHALDTLIAHAQRRNNLPLQIAWLQRAIAQEPTAESLHRMLMEALAYHGESAAALLVYHTLSRDLNRLCHRAPDAETTAVFCNIRDGKMPAPPPTGYIPYPMTTLLGREEETQEVCRLLERFRLVTLKGIGGVGKTRLSIHLAHQVTAHYPDGIWFIDLSEISKADLLPESIAAGMRIDLQNKNGQSALRILQEHIGQKQSLLVLDNCEHLYPECTAVVDKLLTHCGKLRLLATSRHPLKLTGEYLYPVPPLRLPDCRRVQGTARVDWSQAEASPAVQLFVERAAAVRSGFSLHTDNVQSIVRICNHLEGLPLAIELTAARVGAWTVQQIAQQLSDHLALTAQGGPSGPDRQKTLEALIDWSYHLLAPEERTLLACLSIFRGSWSGRSAQAVCAAAGLTPDTISVGIGRLIDHSLIQADAGHERMRYRMPGVVRSYGQACLAQRDLPPEVWACYRDHFLSLVKEAEPGLRGADKARALIELEWEKDNLRAVMARCLETGEGEEALRLAGLLWRFWYVRGYFEEGTDWFQRVLEVKNSEDTLVARALMGAGNLAYAVSDIAAARSFYSRYQEIQQRRNNKHGVASALSSLANLALAEENYAEARSLLECALKVFQDLEKPLDIARTLGNLARTYTAESDCTGALSLHQESVALFRQLGDGHDLTHGINLLANTLLDCNRVAEAVACLRESLARSLVQESRFDLIHSLTYLRKLAMRQEHWLRAALLLGVENAQREEIQMPRAPRDIVEARADEEQILSHLGVAAFQKAYRQGCSLPPAALLSLLFPPLPG